MLVWSANVVALTTVLYSAIKEQFLKTKNESDFKNPVLKYTKIISEKLWLYVTLSTVPERHASQEAKLVNSSVQDPQGLQV